MAGIYIHIPFCKRKCTYCNFFSKVSDHDLDNYVELLRKEMYLQRDYLSGQSIETVYFGGGTPSLLNLPQLERILDALFAIFPVAANPEITLEANPDGLSKEYAGDVYNHTAINRLSIGIQSFDDEELKLLNRLHSGKQARVAIENILNAGFLNISIDFIYGIPTLTHKKWLNNLDIFFGYNLPHLSAYALTVEPYTILSKQIAANIVPPVEEDHTIMQMNMLMTAMREHNYEHYEISNFAKKDCYSKHNSNYWRSVHYLGLGPSAHSFNGTSRQWNVSDVRKYTDAVDAGRLMFQKELLSLKERYNEYVMTAFRTQWGISRHCVETTFGKKQLSYLDGQIIRYLSEKKVVSYQECYILTDLGKPFADGIAADLFL